MIGDEQLLPEEIASIQASLKAVEEGHVEFVHPDLATDALKVLWYSGGSGLTFVQERQARYTSIIPNWYIGMSNEFIKTIQGIDRKLQGRILEAISHISSEPTTPKGDTVKPLTSDLKGLWRYRIGDFRLVYYPDSDGRRVVLVRFSSRSGVYG